MEKTVCDNRKCTGCKACVDKCPKACISVKDELSYVSAVIDSEKCVGCNVCKTVCPVHNVEGLQKPIDCKQGWSLNETIRANSSSGGIATAVAVSFLNKGGIVYACILKKGEFRFAQIITQNDIEKMRGSKYVKSNPQGVYKKIVDDLNRNCKVLFIGLPCQVKAAKNFVGCKLATNFYTIDLICHGSSSPQMLVDYLLKNNIDIKTIENISFRDKMKYGLSIEDNNISLNRQLDSYLKAFLSGISYTENCFTCQFAQLNRTGDITIGDSWASDLNITEQKKGISLILFQTAKGQELIKSSGIHLETVDLEKAIAANHQLEHPTDKPKRYEKFWKGIKKGRSLDFMMFLCFPKATVMNWMKGIKIRLRELAK